MHGDEVRSNLTDVRGSSLSLWERVRVRDLGARQSLPTVVVAKHTQVQKGFCAKLRTLTPNPSARGRGEEDLIPAAQFDHGDPTRGDIESDTV